MKKILIVTSGLSSIGQGGGISSYSHELAQNLSLEGYEVTVFLVIEGIVSNPESVLYKFVSYKVPAKVKEEEAIIRSLLKDINILSPDVIINNDVPYISGLWPVFEKSVIKISVVHGFSKKFTWTNSGITGKMACYNHPYVDYIVCQNSKMVKDIYHKYHVPIDKLIYIPQTINLNIAIKEKQKSQLTILFANGSHIRKGAPVMDEISQRLISTDLDFIVYWCGEASMYEAKFGKDKRFHFVGQLNRSLFLDTLNNSDCIIIPTILDTGPMLLVEAMALGVIPICNNLLESAIPDIVTDGKNGLLVTNNDSNGFFEKIAQLIKNREDRIELSRHAIEYFNSNLTTDKQIERLKQLFERKNSFSQQEILSDKHIVYFHLRDTSKLPKYSWLRIYAKMRNAFEIPMRKFSL
ncbi:MAG: hypothetical protein K0R51_801 [Cytophagaceae bacterium]|jgi:glycosyltransferase involved in cell wall biosynthesis|nr:hypothetical protein [Cytophagaceae bacterium]